MGSGGSGDEVDVEDEEAVVEEEVVEGVRMVEVLRVLGLADVRHERRARLRVRVINIVS